MTKVDFYHLCEESRKNILPFAARLAEKISRMRHEIYFHAPNQETAHSLSDALWGTSPESFLPHSLLPVEDGETCPIAIGFGEKSGMSHDVLINLDGKIPQFFSRFNRVVEILADEEELKQAARERYKFYKDRGYLVDYHEIAKK